MEHVEPAVLTRSERDATRLLERDYPHSQKADYLGICPDIVATMAFLIALLLPTSGVVAEERIEGTVLYAVVTHCEAHGCSGALALEDTTRGRYKTLIIKVPLGTPISRGCGGMRFHQLAGKAVIVTDFAEKGGHVARAIEVVEEAAGDCWDGRAAR